MTAQEVFLIRHGEAEWSLNGRHTGISDIPLTEKGRQVARLWQPYAGARKFALVLSSPLQRARETCELAGLARQAQIEDDLREWNYGEYCRPARAVIFCSRRPHCACSAPIAGYPL